LKKLGAKPGVSDIIIAEPWDLRGKKLPANCWVRHDTGRDVALELKDKGKKPSDEQLKFLQRAYRHGWLTATADDIDQAMDVLDLIEPMNGRKLRDLRQ